MGRVNAILLFGVGYMAKSIMVTLVETSENLLVNSLIMIGLIACLAFIYLDNKK